MPEALLSAVCQATEVLPVLDYASRVVLYVYVAFWSLGAGGIPSPGQPRRPGWGDSQSGSAPRPATPQGPPLARESSCQWLSPGRRRRSHRGCGRCPVTATRRRQRGPGQKWDCPRQWASPQYRDVRRRFLLPDQDVSTEEGKPITLMVVGPQRRSKCRDTRIKSTLG